MPIFTARKHKREMGKYKLKTKATKLYKLKCRTIRDLKHGTMHDIEEKILYTQQMNKSHICT